MGVPGGGGPPLPTGPVDRAGGSSSPRRGEDAVAEGLEDLGASFLDVAEDQGVGQFHDLIARFIQKSGALGVLTDRFGRIVDRAEQFNGQSCAHTSEVRDIGADLVLPPESKTSQTPTSQFGPKPLFSRSRLRPHAPRIALQRRCLPSPPGPAHRRHTVLPLRGEEAPWPISSGPLGEGGLTPRPFRPASPGPRPCSPGRTWSCSRGG
jgi:hypothetical protein